MQIPSSGVPVDDLGASNCTLKFFIDECLSPILAARLNELGIDAVHPLNVGRRGEGDHIVLKRSLDEDRMIVTENAKDFRGLIGRSQMHPGLIILPSIDREGAWRLLNAVLSFLGQQENPRDYMFNWVLEVSEDETIQAHQLPPPS